MWRQEDAYLPGSVRRWEGERAFLKQVVAGHHWPWGSDFGGMASPLEMNRRRTSDVGEMARQLLWSGLKVICRLFERVRRTSPSILDLPLVVFAPMPVRKS